MILYVQKNKNEMENPKSERKKRAHMWNPKKEKKRFQTMVLYYISKRMNHDFSLYVRVKENIVTECQFSCLATWTICKRSCTIKKKKKNTHTYYQRHTKCEYTHSFFLFFFFIHSQLVQSASYNVLYTYKSLVATILFLSHIIWTLPKHIIKMVEMERFLCVYVECILMYIILFDFLPRV